ncbi:SpoIID/LytB domain-containing protein [Paenibacillus sp. MMS20-IR301]|uniref:SpoIID/LytB domain-containing protein n=1 Tax=Paenibacillus sp. MMS20-IR301 TaxID=2895946 RepID=UPI0028E2069B|nr:SpoIID/LytB domain-containing protein [Paenibacillus sp. MMS20-IR301]WNS43643.1 SpoIID/LytB domain-containing protein [Paenibacillus sp. MMS20-IR301]
MKLAKRKKTGMGLLGRGALAALLVAASVLAPAGTTHADANGTIRVALYADIGSKYKSTVPLITLQSDSGFSLLPAAGGAPLLAVPAQNKVRISLDGYRVKVLETPTWQVAADAAKKLQSTSDKPQLFMATRGGAKVYQLYTGGYASESAATNGLASVQKAGLALPAGQTPAVAGTKHLSAGAFTTLEEAQGVVGSFTAAGLDAWPVFVSGADGSTRTEVWVGEAVNDSSLAAISASAAAALPQYALTPLAAGSSGLIVRMDAGLDFTTETQAFHYLLSGSEAKFVAAGNEKGILLTERSKRIYRGDLELGSLNGSLSVINVVPLEQYLYAVVGGEVSSGWPEEALKAQAVAARSYALAQGNRFDVANVVDTTLSQVYNGISAEAPVITRAVDATAGEVLMSGGKIVEAVFSSNSGGVTADPSEVWNNGGDTFVSVASAEDAAAVASSKKWYYLLLDSGISGYAREDNIKLTGNSTAAGLPLATATAKDVNIRPLPVIESSVTPTGKLNPGDNAVVLDQVFESGSYSWIKGPYTSADLLKSLTGKVSGTLPSSITSLQVTKRGPSGRAVEVKANGQILQVKYPDLFRSSFGGLPSTLFDIVPAGSYTVLGADGSTAAIGSSASAGVLSATGKVTAAGSGTVVMGADQTSRVVTNSPGFYFIGWGNGHGLGMSQWGVKGMADSGYDYKQILQHYFNNVTIVKE